MEAVHSSTKKRTNVRSKNWRIWLTRSVFGVLQVVAPNRSARWAADLFCTPRRHRPPVTEERLLALAAEHRIQVAGQRIAVWRMGIGPAVLLVHGWEGRGAQMSAIARSLVDAGFQVVWLDGPGHGQSDGSRSSVPQMARALLGVGEEFGPFYAVVGHSFGTAATSFALDQGFSAERLVYLAPPADFDDYVLAFAELLGLSDEIRRRTIAELESRFHVAWHELRRVNVRRTRQIPLLVIHDADDREVPLSEGKRVARAWPRGRLMITSGLGHRRIIKNSEVARTTASFLQIIDPTTFDLADLVAGPFAS